MDYVIAEEELINDFYKDLTVKIWDNCRNNVKFCQKTIFDRCLSKLQLSKEVETLENRLLELADNISQCQKANEAYDRIISEKQSKFQSLSQDLQRKLLKVEKSKQIHDKVEALRDQLEKERGLKGKYSNSEISKMKEMLQLHNDRLSFNIEFAREDSDLIFNLRFTNIDNSNFERIFTVKVIYDSDSRSISTIECSPEIDGLDKLKMLSIEEVYWHKIAVLTRMMFKQQYSNAKLLK